MALVLDASVTMAWCFPDEASPFTEAILDRVRDEEGLAPLIWPLEVANAFLLAERRGRITNTQTVYLIELLQALPITVDSGALTEAWGSVLALGREYGLSSYDAAYLELAARQGLPLATQDAQLRAAATRMGIALVD